MTILDEICAKKREHVARKKSEVPVAELESTVRYASPVRGFEAALRKASVNDGTGLIAEIKKASPSKGLIRADFDPPALARAIPDQLKGGDAETNALALSALVDGHEGPYRDIVLLNSAAALIVAGKADNLTMGVKMAAAAVDAGGARKALDTLVRVSNLDIEPAEASARA